VLLLPPWSRFKLNVSAGSQKRKIHKPEGRNESRFSLKSKRNRKRKYILSLFGQTRFYLDKSCHYSDKQTVWAFGRCVQNDSMVGFSEETKRKKRSLKRSEKIPVFQPKHNARFNVIMHATVQHNTCCSFSEEIDNNIFFAPRI
jgi:hypothetical protein